MMLSQTVLAMSGILLSFRGRAFWDKHNFDVWLYHLSYLIKQSDDMPDWAIEWADQWLELIPQQLPDYLYAGWLDALTDDDRVALVVDLSRQVLHRLQRYGDFLNVEKQKWQAAGHPLERTRNRIDYG